MIWKDTYNFLDTIKDKKRYGIFLDMGVGKTSLLLSLIDHKFFSGVKKVLIITPKQVSLSTWQEEIKKWDNFNYMIDSVKLIHGNEDKRNKILSDVKEFQIHIISSSLVEWLSGKRVRKGKRFVKEKNKLTPDYDLIIVDECSQFKDTRTRRFKALKSLSKESQLFLLSGTPFSNIERDKYGLKKADELYYILYLLGIYKDNITAFRNDFCFTFNWDLYTYRMKKDVYDVLIEKIAKYSIRKKLEMQIQIKEEKVYVETDQKRLQTLKNDYYIETNGLDNITASNQAIMINKALQVSNGFAYDSKGFVERFNHNKLQALKEIIKNTKGNILVFYNFKEDRDNILNSIQGAVLYKGNEEKQRWNKGEIKVLLLSPFSGKYGLNLQQGGNTIVWFGLVWSAESYEQSNARLYRRGQTKDVSIYYILGTRSFDDYVYNKLVAKVKNMEDFKTYLV